MLGVPLRVSFHTTNIEQIKQLKILEAAKIIELSEEKFQYCTNRNCGTKILVSEQLLHEGVTTCPSCTKTVRLSKSTFSEIKIRRINYQEIIKLCSNRLQGAYGKEKCAFDSERHCWFCSINERNIPIFITEVSSYNQYVNNKIDPCWLCVVVDWERNEDKLNNYNQLNFIRVEDILQDSSKLSQRVDLIGKTFPSNSTVQLERAFDEYINGIKGQEFEAEFVKKLMNMLKEKTMEFEQYLRFLSIQKDSITNTKAVFMGSAANADFALINLHEYLQRAFTPTKIGEAKRYHHTDLSRTRFTWSHYCEALGHADEADTLFIISTNNIAPSVWRKVVEKRLNKGYFKDVIVEKDTLLLLIKVLGMEDLLSSGKRKAAAS